MKNIFGVAVLGAGCVGLSYAGAPYGLAFAIWSSLGIILVAPSSRNQSLGAVVLRSFAWPLFFDWRKRPALWVRLAASVWSLWVAPFVIAERVDYLIYRIKASRR